MPGMVAFGRRWLLATDDFIIQGVFDIIAFFPWMIWSGVESYKWLSSDERAFYEAPFLYDVAFTLFFCNVTVAWLFGFGFAYCSTRGTISQVEARWSCVLLFHLKTVLLLPKLLWLLLAGYLLNTCNMKMGHTLLIETVMESIFLFAILIGGWLIYDNEGSSSSNEPKKERISDANSYLGPVSRSEIRKWKHRLLAFFYCCTSTSRDRKEAINTISELLAHASNEFNIVLSDFVAGIILMRRKHLKYYRAEELATNASPAIALADGSPVNCFPTTDMPEWMNFYLARRYFPNIIGALGWRWIFYRNIFGLCSLWKHLVCCLPCKKNSIIEDDNCCGCNTAGLLVTSRVPYKDLVHVSFYDKIYSIPFFVNVDAETSSVIVTVRAALSLNCVLSVVAAGLARLEEFEEPSQEIYCHAGMLKAARRIRDALYDKGILKAAFVSREDYHLVITGHSLGANVAVLLTLLLRPLHPSVRCFAFEPSPIITANALHLTFECVFSIMCGNAVVPYLSIYNVRHMVDEVIRCALESNLPKYKVLFSDLPESDEEAEAESLDGKANYGKEVNCAKIFQSKEKKPCEGETQSKQVTVVNTHEPMDVNNWKKSLTLKEFYKTNLCVPGRILQIKYSKYGYRLRLRSAEEYEPLRMRPGMIMHHMPQYIQACLEQLGHTRTLQSVSK